jgi:Endonuclease NucS
MSEPKQQVMDAILFSANPNMVSVDDAIRHLADHKQLYWSVGFQIVRENFSYPMYGFMHISGGQVEYRATICDIIPFSRAHYEDEALAPRVKPGPWIREWKVSVNEARSRDWKNALVITEIVPFSYATCSFEKPDGTRVQTPPNGYVRVLPPDHTMQLRPPSMPPEARRSGDGVSLAERNLEDFIVQQLEAIESGLQLVDRQLSTPAGRLDLLCKDANGNYVVIELKRMQGTDQVVGQILRYMGWLKEAHPTEKVRGIVIVGKNDQALSYAIRAVPDVQVKEFKLQIQDAL